jgi:hypothetical protein
MKHYSLILVCGFLFTAGRAQSSQSSAARLDQLIAAGKSRQADENLGRYVE